LAPKANNKPAVIKKMILFLTFFFILNSFWLLRDVF